MIYAILIVVGIPLFALVFSCVTLILGKISVHFETEGLSGFGDLYLHFLIIAGVYVVLSMLGIGGLLGLAVMALTYKSVFHAGWPQALVIGLA